MKKTYTFRILFVLSLSLFPWLVLGPVGNMIDSFAPRVLAFGVITALCACLFKLAWPERSWAEAGIASALINGAVYQAASYIPTLSTYPFSLGWSEASRYYYASLFFSQNIYGQWVPPSVLHPTRYLMQAIPFLISGLPLWFHRLWQVLLWLVFTGWAALLLARRLHLMRSYLWLMFSLWAFLFIFQGPVYYHLLVMVIIVLWFYDRNNFWKTFIAVLAASAWAGVSRINWAPVPGMLAAALYFIEEDKCDQPLWRYLAPPAIWTVMGGGLGLAVEKTYERFSGNPPEWFGSSFTSDLLWYRLFPSVTYPLGVWPAVLLVSLPVLILAFLKIKDTWRRIHPIRWLALLAILALLFAGGSVVSAKIGGGSNLHNMDAYLVLLLVICSYIFFGRFSAGDRPAGPSLPETAPLLQSQQAQGWLGRSMVAAAVIVPALFSATYGDPYVPMNLALGRSELAQLKSSVEQVAQGGGQVLFIDEAQMLTFHEINAPLVPNYEKVFLMEMAMGNNKPYLNAFYDDLSRHRFAMIVSHPLKKNIQANHTFGEENNAWVERVAIPVLCYYKSVAKLPYANIELYVPKDSSGDCK